MISFIDQLRSVGATADVLSKTLQVTWDNAAQLFVPPKHTFQMPVTTEQA